METNVEKKKIRVRNRYFSGPNKLLFADYVFIIVLFLLMLTVVIPVLNVVSISVSSDVAVNANPAMIIPSEVSFDTYKALLSGAGIWRSIGLTVLYVVVFVVLRLVTSLFGGYVISRPNLPGKRIFTTFLLIPTLFSGGLMPTYMVINELGLVDNILVFVIPGCVSCFHILLVRTYIKTLPSSVEEAAEIDGANLMQVLFLIIVPMSIPILITIGIITALSKWNDWWNGFMYIESNTWMLPLQNIVRNLTIEQDTNAMRELDISISNYAEGFKMTVIVVTSLPMVCIYPFCQKYFEQGMNLGSVKD